jgi:hypothetical protein
MRDHQRQLLQQTRLLRPESIQRMAETRQHRAPFTAADRLLIVAADHPARGAINVGSDPTAMGNRLELLDRLTIALNVPGVDGVLGTPDIIEDLLILGALENKVVFGSMNRGGLPGATFEMDDRFTAYTPDAIVRSGLDGGKMLLRINPDDHGTANTLAACAAAVTELSAAGRIAMLEPFMNKRVDGRTSNELTTEAVIRSMGIASALGASSAFSWLKVPVVDDMSRVVEAATLPLVLLGGEQSDQPDEMFARWAEALQLPGVFGLVVGRNLLYPPDDDIVSAVKTAASLL